MSPKLTYYNVYKISALQIMWIEYNYHLDFQDSDEDSDSERQTEREKRRQRAVQRIAKRKEQNEKNIDPEKLRAPVVSRPN